ncbi:MAG: MoxR family ATPase, partial [Acidimicrobiales bacterium]|nr:MoxR family ATPase [Acidimicrobiales bacterium]
MSQAPESVADLQEQLRGVDYLADRGLATATLIALRLGRPLLLEGEVGVGKTELAKCLA